MSLGFGMGAGLRALTASRLGMQTAGNNVSNANTKGYSRQRVELSAASPFTIGRGLQLGTGVEVGGISRLVDGGLERRIQMQMGMQGAALLDYQRLDEVEGILGEPDGGLSATLAGLFGAVEQLRTDPADRALRGGLTQAGSKLAQGFRLVAGRLGDLGASTFDEVRGLVRQVNQSAAKIAELNRQIVAVEATGATANDLRDTRAQAIKDVGGLLDVNAIERSSGSVDLLVGGTLLVAGDRVSALSVGKDAAGGTMITAGATGVVTGLRSGRIPALLAQEQGKLPGIGGRIDQLARNTILEWNRIHSTGMPSSGPFATLTSAYAAKDRNGSGVAGDELLNQAGLPFDVQTGELYVAVTDQASGALQRTRIAVDPRAMTLQGLAAELSKIPHLSSTVDPTGRLRISADAGYGFDFSPRLDPAPDSRGTFGGTNPTVGSTRSGPYDLSGQTFPLVFAVTTGPASAPVVTNVTLQANEFANPAAATVDELVAAINQDLGTTGTATAVGGRLVLRSAEGGSAAHMQLANVGAGTALQALGLSGAAANGRDTALSVQVSGTYTGSSNQQLVFVPESDGRIGQTQDLRIQVRDRAGNLLTTLNVGAGYEPGTPLAIGNGVKVAFGTGEISATHGNAFELDTLADSDTSDVLVALGLNSFFLGTGAGDIEMNPELLANPDRVAAGIGTAGGDASNLARLVGLRTRNLGGLDANTLEDFYADLVGDVGFDVSAAKGTVDAQQQLLDYLQAEREKVSGVNVDEEMVDMMRFQQSYEAAARFISIAQQMTDTLINLGR
jgi:flagellar hook-associated protein FlgK